MTREQVDEYWDTHKARIVDAYADGEINRNTMMKALQELARDIDAMMQRVEVN